MDPIEEAEAQAEKKTAIEDFAQARVAGHGAWTPWTHDARVALTRARQAGCTLDELGQVAGVTRARIYQVLLETNDPTYRERYNAMERAYWGRKLGVDTIMATNEQNRKSSAQYQRVMRDILADLTAYRHTIGAGWVNGTPTEAQATAALNGWEKLATCHIAQLKNCIAERV